MGAASVRSSCKSGHWDAIALAASRSSRSTPARRARNQLPLWSRSHACAPRGGSTGAVPRTPWRVANAGTPRVPSSVRVRGTSAPTPPRHAAGHAPLAARASSPPSRGQAGAARHTLSGNPHGGAPGRTPPRAARARRGIAGILALLSCKRTRTKMDQMVFIAFLSFHTWLLKSPLQARPERQAGIGLVGETW